MRCIVRLIILTSAENVGSAARGSRGDFYLTKRCVCFSLGSDHGKQPVTLTLCRVFVQVIT
jgi:hypothetical protein